MIDLTRRRFLTWLGLAPAVVAVPGLAPSPGGWGASTMARFVTGAPQKIGGFAADLTNDLRHQERAYELTATASWSGDWSAIINENFIAIDAAVRPAQ